MSDLIDRDETLKVIKELSAVNLNSTDYANGFADGYYAGTRDAEPKIIRCKDCKWWGYDDDNEVVRVCHAAKHGYMSSNWSIMIYRTHKGYFYCADAERRTDE